MDLSLRYEDNGTLHDDITLRFAGKTEVGDSYYFALDRNILSGDESSAKIKAVLGELLGQWLEAVANLTDCGTAFLPYDFSDQGTGWLRCQRHGNAMIISRGYALVEGWSIFPSVIGKYLFDLPGFDMTGPTMQMSSEEFLQAIRSSLAEAA